MSNERAIILKKCTVRRLRGRENEPLGFRMIKCGNLPNFISQVEPDSAAVLSGLCYEDFIIELNGDNVELDCNNSLREKILICLNSKGEFRLTTLNKAGYDYCTEKKIKPTDFIEQNRQCIVQFETPDLRAIGRLKPRSRFINSNIRKSAIEIMSEDCFYKMFTFNGNDFGFSVYGDQSKGYFVEKTSKEVKGINTGDKIIQIDGLDVEGLSSDEICQVLNKAKLLEKIRILVDPKEEKTILETITRRVNIEKLKKNQTIGLTIVKTENEHVITQVDSNSLGEKFGLKVNNVIQEINEQNIQNMSNFQIEQLVNSNKKLSFIVKEIKDQNTEYPVGRATINESKC